jgi:hypothetical protein
MSPMRFDSGVPVLLVKLSTAEAGKLGFDVSVSPRVTPVTPIVEGAIAMDFEVGLGPATATSPRSWPRLVSNLVSKPGDFAGFCRLSRLFDLLPSITYVFPTSWHGRGRRFDPDQVHHLIPLF